MAITHEFEYLRPATLGKALKALAKYGRKAKVLAGGTDLVGLLNDEILQPDAVIDIKAIEELRALEFKNGKLQIGALTTFSELLESDEVRRKFPVIAEMAGWVASLGIRNRATMAGNICSAVPCCDSGPILLLYDALIHAKSRDEKRKIPIAQWFAGPRKTVLKNKEIVTGLSMPEWDIPHAACFVKLRRYEGEDLAQASVAVLVDKANNYRIAYGSVGPKPFRGAAVEALLTGKPLNEALLKKAVELARLEIQPITDIRSTKEYRSHMTGVMLERGLRAAVSRLAGKGPAYGASLI
ncbi:MAG TPA: FAD-binding protein [Verrucomicrobia bacterium]|nr:MAG: FAD-binding protein [Lentisphaerae bacterium GWF2_57_35]HBA84465.1 FAD-binding protein [Verrucomicrobiota bacterium]